MTTLAERIKKVRKDAKLTQPEFAKEVGVGWGAVAGWEQGKIKPGDSRLYVIADRFAVNLDWLQAGEGNVYKKENVENSKEYPVDIETIKKLFQALPLRLQKLVIEAMREMVETGEIVPRSLINTVDISGEINGNVEINQNGEKSKE